ncbi:SRPBCC domain-containing protein [Zunongwangia sp. HGR-M22]|uniref:SRPBCC domain-containing protein n=1 Tax=Zunongwangia sp. HGR-M22 TaxID=3015168 RepID=UPI0022DD9CBF|nr:SRPBCC domain-containing protein [Zunongwangia sp. HGR-M22]WBL24303.1 SRPBCC domain-containing protein [Zunongwangia sp. HGR-M22]
MRKEIKTEITINANPQKVWEVLTELDQYPKWNPFMKEIYGILRVGERLKVIIQPEGSSKMTFKPIILALEENKTLKWMGKLVVTGLFDGTHLFHLIDNGNGTTTFKQSEVFKGILVGLFNLANTKTGFDRMNIELKKRCETKDRIAV